MNTPVVVISVATEGVHAEIPDPWTSIYVRGTDDAWALHGTESVHLWLRGDRTDRIVHDQELTLEMVLVDVQGRRYTR